MSTYYLCMLCDAPVLPVFHHTQLSCGHPIECADTYDDESN